jgi:hypothetical protein
MQRLTARTNTRLKMLAHAIGHEKLRFFGPAIPTLRQSDLFLAERFAVRRTGVLFMWGPVGNVTINNDERRPIVRVLERCEGAIE